jgi:hypothetical protein
VVAAKQADDSNSVKIVALALIGTSDRNSNDDASPNPWARKSGGQSRDYAFIGYTGQGHDSEMAL